MPAGYRAGIPQQPYTKYESDNEEIKVEYKRVDNNNVTRLDWFVGYKGSILRILIVIIVFMFGLILGYVIHRSTVKESPLHAQPPPSTDPTSDLRNKVLSHRLIDFIDAENIELNLKNYSQTVHLSGVHSNNRLSTCLRLQLQRLHLVVKEAKYKVLLSYHNWERPNTVQLLSANGSLVYQTDYRGPAINGDTRSADHPEITQGYVAYSPNGTAQGEIVYANYGEEKDFKLLEEKGISCEDKIVIMRTGQIFLGHMVKHAQEHGASGVILYPDPSDVLDEDLDERDAYPQTHSLPGWATQRGSLWRFGDPLTPGNPSKEGVNRLPVYRALLPKIPVQPVSYDDARRLMSFMKGPVDHDFIGMLHGNVTYSMGPGYNSPQEDWKVRVNVHNDYEVREITNVLAVIKGLEEPDSYIIVGCHYDAWTYGGVDPNTGVAILMELAKAFDMLTSKGWLPRRTLIFAFWDAGEMGQIGSYEWVEDHLFELTGRTVAYINLDEAVIGSHVVDVESSPLLRDLLTNASKRVQSFVSNDGYNNLYDLWVKTLPAEDDTSAPRFNYPSPDSDHAAFLYLLGAPVIWPRFTDRKFMSRSKQYPAHHTAIDNYEYVKRFVDPTFVAHETMAHFVGEIILQLSALPRLPLDIRELTETLEQEYNGLQQEGLHDFKYMLDHLQWAIGNFSEAAILFYDNLQHLDLISSHELLEYNNRLMRVSSAFVQSQNLLKPQIRNVLFAPSDSTSYPYSTFTGIHDAFESYLKATSDDKKISRILLEKQISTATLAIQMANRALIAEDIFQ